MGCAKWVGYYPLLSKEPQSGQEEKLGSGVGWGEVVPRGSHRSPWRVGTRPALQEESEVVAKWESKG